MEPDLQPLGEWGSPVTVGINAPQEPTDGFWGPRDVAIDSAGNVYIADTGNKRVRVYSAEGVWLRDIGSGGSGEGQLDEPTGLAVSADGRLFVADTWNRRIAVFDLEGRWLVNYPVRAWYGEPVNRPYIAIDEARQLLYIGDPEGGRILVQSLQSGECIGAFGRLNTETEPLSNEFGAVGGIAVDGNGYIYVTDVLRGRVLKFAPFPVEQVTAPEGEPITVEIVPPLEVTEEVVTTEEVVATEEVVTTEEVAATEEVVTTEEVAATEEVTPTDELEE
ncbi:MAG: NHL repeat-containing protein [Anaerolineae bacterium]|nr:NHL repeat-containing protein [Anaerolineae bacterium]